MKAESSNFAADRVKRDGMQPVYLWNFTNATFKISTIPLTVTGVTSDAGTYNPYVLTFEEIDFSLEEGNNFGSVGSCRVILARNTTTDALLTGAQIGTSVRVNLAFYKGTTIADVDLMPMARFVFGGVSEITQAQFTITLLADERKLKPLPISRLPDNATVPEQNRGKFIPIALGQFKSPVWTANTQMLRGIGNDYIPCVLANEGYNAAHTYGGNARTDIGELVVAENKVGSTSTPVVDRLYQYVAGMDTHVLVNYSTNDVNGPVAGTSLINTWEYTNTSGDAWLPASTNAGRLRLTFDRYMTRQIEGEHIGNTINDYSGGNNFNWKNLNDYNGNNRTRVQAGQAPPRNLLLVRWMKAGSPSPVAPAHGYLTFVITDADKTTGGGTRIRIKLGRIDTGALDSAFTTFDIISSTTLPILFYIHYNTAAVAIADTTFGAVGWNWDNIFILLDVIGVTTTSTQYAELASIGVELFYNDLQHNFKKAEGIKFTYRNEILGRKKRKGIIPGDITVYGPRQEFLEITDFSYLPLPDAAIFADYTSSTTMNIFTISWGEIFGAPWMLAAILGDVLGYPAGEFDINQFDKVSNNHMINSKLSVYVDREWESADLLRNIAFQGNILAFYGGEGKWKIQPKWRFISYTGQQTPLQFADNSATYIVSNLFWSIAEPQYNKFRLLYQFDYARNKYIKKSEKDESVAVPNGQPYPDIEGLFIRDDTTANEWLDLVFVKYHNQRRRMVEFNTSLAASHLELGDFIKVSHNALPDNTPIYQITQIRYGPASIFIKAIQTHT